MELATERLAFVSAAAAEIDRLVVGGHARAGDYQDKPSAVTQMTAFPHLLDFAAIVLLGGQALTRTDVARIVPYTPSALVEGLIDNNITEGIVSERESVFVLTDRGRAAAEGVVLVQESSVAELWSSTSEAVKTADELLARIVQHARAIGPPRTPSNFALFAAVCDRPTTEGSVLRLLTSMRYWRSDAHGCALAEADLRPFEAHALNRLWDAGRGIDRVGQGFPEPGRKGVASLEARGLASTGTITPEGIELREQIEHATDELTAPIYDPLDERSRERLLAALKALPI